MNWTKLNSVRCEQALIRTLLLLFADNQVMQSMLGEVTDVDVSSCHVAED